MAVSRRQSVQPMIEELTRRETMLLMASLVTVPLMAAAEVNSNSEMAPGDEAVALPGRPSHGPGFSARGLEDGGLLLWFRGPNDAITGYRLNPNGRRVWALCDGRRSMTEIGSAYRRMTKRSSGEAVEFLASLTGIGAVAVGGFAIVRGSFPRAPEGKGYHVLIENLPLGKS